MFSLSAGVCLISSHIHCDCREGRGNAHLDGDYRKIGDIILRNFNQNTLDHYTRYIDTHLIVLDKLEQTLHKNSKFEQVYRDFEMQKVCYLPLTTLLLKPLHRVLHYQLLLESKTSLLISKLSASEDADLLRDHKISL